MEEEQEEEMPFIFRVTEPFAIKKIKALGFDRRRRESKIYETAIHRYYMDILEMAVAFVVIVGRLYLAIDIGQPYSGSMPLNESDALVFFISIMTLTKNRMLVDHYKKNVVNRIEAVAKKR